MKSEDITPATKSNNAYFIPSVPTFIPEDWRTDGTYNEDTWPPDAVLLDESLTLQFWKVTPPEGFYLGVLDGMPEWVARQPPSYQQALSALNATYQIDVEKFNRAFAIAYLSDGPSQESKQAAIRTQYEARKVQHAADSAALKVQYGIGV